MKLKISFVVMLTIIISTSFSQNLVTSASSHSVDVPIGGNAYTTNKERTGGSITNNGIVNWTDEMVEFKI